MPRIRPGHHLYRLADGHWRYSTPDESFVRISGADAVLAGVRDDLYGVPRPPDDASAEAGRLLLDGLRSRGALDVDDEPDGAPAGAPGLRVHVEGDNPVADAVAGLLCGSSVSRGPVDEGVVAAVDVVVACAGWLPDAHWTRLDAWCAGVGTAWHRVHLEGSRWCLGPFTNPGRTAGYRDLRGRRLAASAAPAELAGLWKALDEGPTPPVTWPDPAQAAIVAGLVAADVLTWGRGTAPPGGAHQVVVDPATAAVSRHRVLPLPVTAAARS